MAYAFGAAAASAAAAWAGKLTFIMRHVIPIYHPYAPCTKTKAIAAQADAYSNSDLDTKSVWSCQWRGKGRERRGRRRRRLIHQGVESTDLLLSFPLRSATGRQRGKPLPRFDLGPARSLAPGMASVNVNTTCHNMSSPLWCPVVCHCPSVPLSRYPFAAAVVPLSLGLFRAYDLYLNAY